MKAFKRPDKCTFLKMNVKDRRKGIIYVYNYIQVAWQIPENVQSNVRKPNSEFTVDVFLSEFKKDPSPVLTQALALSQKIRDVCTFVCSKLR